MPVGNKMVKKGDILTFTLIATDPDGDPLTCVAANLPPGAVFDPDTMTFSWMAPIGPDQTCPQVRFQVSDGIFMSSQSLTIYTVSSVDPPAMSAFDVAAPGTTSTVIRWTTDVPSTSQVEYWAGSHQLTAKDEALVTDHRVALEGLNPGTPYTYRVLSEDRLNRLTTSEPQTFSTGAAFTVSTSTT